MEKINIPNYGTVDPDWLSRMLNRLSSLEQIRKDIHSRYCCIYEILIEKNPSVEDNIYHKVFADGVLAEYKKMNHQIELEILTILSCITDAKNHDSVDLIFAPCDIKCLQEEVEKFKNLEDNYHAAREVLLGGDKPLAYPQVRWLSDSFDKDFEREKVIFADRLSNLIQNR